MGRSMGSIKLKYNEVREDVVVPYNEELYFDILANYLSANQIQAEADLSEG